MFKGGRHCLIHMPRGSGSFRNDSTQLYGAIIITSQDRQQAVQFLSTRILSMPEMIFVFAKSTLPNFRERNEKRMILHEDAFNRLNSDRSDSLIKASKVYFSPKLGKCWYFGTSSKRRRGRFLYAGFIVILLYKNVGDTVFQMVTSQFERFKRSFKEPTD